MRTLIGLILMAGGLYKYGIPIELWAVFGGYILWTIGDAQDSAIVRGARNLARPRG